MAANLLKLANDTRITPFGIASLSAVSDQSVSEECGLLIEKFIMPKLQKEMDECGDDACPHIVIYTLKLLFAELVYEIKRTNGLLKDCEFTYTKDEHFKIKIG